MVTLGEHGPPRIHGKLRKEVIKLFIEFKGNKSDLRLGGLEQSVTHVEAKIE